MARNFVIPNILLAALKTGTRKAMYNFQETAGWKSDCSNNLHGLVQSQFYGCISAERINGGSYFRLTNKFDSNDRGLFLKYLTF